MKRRYGVLVVAALIVPGFASAQDGGGIEVVCVGDTPGLSPLAALAIDPFAVIEINGARADVSRCITQVGKLFVLNADFFSQVATGNVHALMNPDPFISFGTTTTNLVPGATTFAFLFGTPVVPTFYNSATSTGGVTVTNGLSGTTTVATSIIYPTYISAYGTLGLAPTNLGVDLGTLPCVAGPGVPLTVTNTCNQGTTSNTFAPTFYDNLEALLTYTQNDVSSVASWSGAVTLNAATVPEPATVSLLATGALVLGLGGLARRRQG